MSEFVSEDVRMEILGGEKEIAHLSCSVGLVALNHSGGGWAVGGVGGDD